jgi:alpha-L-fucosidase 2
MGNTERTALYTDDPAARGIRFLGALELRTDGQMQHRGNIFTVKGASSMELRLAVETSFNGYEKHPFLEGKPYKQLCFDRLAAVRSIPESELRAAHVKDHRKYFNRVSLSLGTDGKSNTPTSQRLARYAAGGADRALPALLFHFGRYITIASSRKGTQATNLQGIWNEQFFPPWHGNYTVNINTEMNYSPTLVIGLPEMYEPLLRLIKEVSEAGRLTAREMYGAEGWVCHHNTDLWRHTQPVAGVATYSFWNAAGAWFCHHLAEYYDYTLDRKFLEKTAFPILLSAAEFYLSQLEDAEDGTRIVCPSTSPENKFRCEGGSSAVAETTEMTMATVRELFRNIDRFAALLQVENDLTRRVASELPRLRPTAVGGDGRVLEWYGEKTDTEPHHRHLSHLYDLHPGHAITPTKTPELAKACERSLEARGGEGTGWNLAWKCNCYARLGQGDRALELVRMQLRPTKERNVNYHGGGGSYPNLLCAHPPFQIDGNFGITAGMAEMLLQSAPDEVHVLPALPAAWQDVSVRGLAAMGRRKVNFRVKNGKLTDCEIIGPTPAKIYVGGEDMTARFILRDGKSVLQN